MHISGWYGEYKIENRDSPPVDYHELIIDPSEYGFLQNVEYVPTELDILSIRTLEKYLANSYD